MTYDHWKSTEPDEYVGPFGPCEYCGRAATLERVWGFGIETYVCDACRGEPRPFTSDESQNP